jgi:hypothetical protein
MRLSKGSPERETTINYIMNMNDGSGVIKKKSISSYQGAREPYYSNQSRIKDGRNMSKDNTLLLTSSRMYAHKKLGPNTPNNFMKKRRTT